ncbi:MAG: AI-2E family transporter [Bacillota bacterium]
MSRKTKWIAAAILAAPAALYLLWRFAAVFWLVFAAAVISYLLSPAVAALTRRGVPVAAACAVCYGIIAVSLTFAAVVLLPLLYGECSSVLSSLPVYYRYLLSLWERYLDGTAVFRWFAFFGFDEKLSALFLSWGERFASRTVEFLAFLPTLAFYALLTPVLSYYFLRDRERAAEAALRVFPPRARSAVLTVGREANDVFFAFVRGNLLIAAIVAAMTGVGLFLCGVESAAVLGVLYGLMDLIPYFGPVLGAVPVVLLSLLQGNVNIFLVLALIFLIQQAESTLITPKILGDRVGLHPVSVIVLVLIGGSVGGLAGMVLMIPLAAVAKVVLKYCYEKLVATDID